MEFIALNLGLNFRKYNNINKKWLISISERPQGKPNLSKKSISKTKKQKKLHTEKN